MSKTPSEDEFQNIVENLEYDIGEKDLLYYLEEAKIALNDSLSNYYSQRKRLELFGAFVVALGSFLISSYFSDFFNPEIDNLSKFFLFLILAVLSYVAVRIVNAILPTKVHYPGNYPSAFIFPGYDSSSFFENLRGEIVNYQGRLVENEAINEKIARVITEVLIFLLINCILLMFYLWLRVL